MVMLIPVDQDCIADTRRVQESGTTVLHRVSAEVSAIIKTGVTVVYGKAKEEWI